MKQTAVEWLVKEFSEILGPLKTEPMQDLLIVDAINQAKAMHKKQIIDALMTSEVELLSWGISAEQYYNETYSSGRTESVKSE